jgi:hypothetical protein
MAGNQIPADLLARLKARIGDPARQSDTASLTANSTDIESLMGGLPPIADPALQNQVERLQGMLSNAMAMLGSVSGERGPVLAMCGPGPGFGGGIVSLGGPAAQPAEIIPCSDGDVAATEVELGFALPDALRQLYLEVGDGGFGPGDGLYSRDRLVAKYREMTGEAVGRDGEVWPSNLLPIAGADWDLISIDRDSGRLVYFDAEELAEQAPDSWDKAFKPEADSLADWLAGWLDAPTPAEEYRAWDEELRRSRG